jgi:DNA processing protein
MLQSPFVNVPAHELKYWVSFARIPGLGRVRFNQLLEYFNNLANAWKATPGEFSKAGLDARSVASIRASRAGIEPERELEQLERYHVKAIPFVDADYPVRLREVYDYPPVIFMRGTIPPSIDNGIAVVGTRRITAYGRQVAEDIVEDLARSGLVIVSGLARGVDTVAHRAALESGGVTLAVCACGLDTVYPAENARLAAAIMERGSLISEHPLGIKPKAENFPLRNRIMSGLCLGVIVIEAGESSGALITARQAIEQDREVFAVPGSIYSPASKGTNRLIQISGAKLVLTANDILDELGMAGNCQQSQLAEPDIQGGVESAVLGQLSTEPVSQDEICRRSGLSASLVASTLTVLELRGVARSLGNSGYTLARVKKVGSG